MNQRGAVNLHLVLTIFLGIGVLVFGVLAVIAYRDNEYVHANLDQIVTKERAEASEIQKNADEVANRKANELPYRTFKADPVDGSFELQVPKSWSSYAARNNGNATQLEFIAHPDTVSNNISSGSTNTHAFKLKIVKSSQTAIARSYDDKIKKKQLTSSAVTVSGLSGLRLEGIIDDKRHTGVVIILPVRDKTMVFTTDSRDYLEQFNQMVTTAKIVP